MSKECLKCKTIVSDDSKFCTVCGGAEFAPFAVECEPAPEKQIQNQAVNNQQPFCGQPQPQFYAPPQPVYNQPHQPQPNPNPQTPHAPANFDWYQPTSVAPPKKKKTGLICGIIGVVIVFIAVSLVILALVDSGNDFTLDTTSNKTAASQKTTASEYNDDYIKTTLPAIEYTKGYFNGTTYANEWANIYIEKPSGFSNASADDYTSFENATTDCGLYISANDLSATMSVMFEDVSYVSQITESSYMDILVEGLEESINLQLVSDYTTTDISGYNYLTANGVFYSEGSSLQYDIYVRRLDDYMIVIFIAGLTDKISSECLALIEPLS